MKNNTELDQPLISLREWGHQRSDKSLGHSASIKPCLEIIYAQQMQEDAANGDAITERIHQSEQRKQGLLTSIEQLKQKQLQIKQEVIPTLLEKVARLKEEMKQMKLQGIKEPIDFKTVLVTSLLVTALTVYLFLFYSSAIYTAFYGAQDLQAALEKGRVIITAVFNTEAIPRAALRGVTTLIFILIFPAIFISLGFLLHKFLQKKQFAYLSFIILATLAFDVVIAYLIAKNIHDVRYLARLEEHAWQAGIAWEDINFYFVILAGFVVYIIWGFLLDVLLSELEKNNLSLQQKRLSAELGMLKSEKEQWEAQIEQEKKQINDWELQIKQLKGDIANEDKETARLKNGGVVVNLNELTHKANDFLQGWKDFLYSHYAQQKADRFASEATQIVSQWIQHKRNN